MKMTLKSAADVRADRRDALKSALAEIRWTHQTGGLSLPDGTFIRTDDHTRAALTEAVNSLKAGVLSVPVPWKMANGHWADLGEADLLGITAAVTAHVQASFAAERAVSAQIDATEDPSGFDVPTAFAAALI